MVGARSSWKGWLGTGEDVSFGVHVLFLPQEIPKAHGCWDTKRCGVVHVPGNEESCPPTPCYTSSFAGVLILLGFGLPFFGAVSA